MKTPYCYNGLSYKQFTDSFTNCSLNGQPVPHLDFDKVKKGDLITCGIMKYSAIKITKNKVILF